MRLQPKWLGHILGLIKTEFSQRPNLQRVVANSSWLLFDRLLRLAVSIFIGAWVARYLQPEQFGILSYSVAFVSIFGAIAGLGLDSIVVREIVERPEKKDEILSTAFSLKFVSGLIAFSISIFTAWLISNDSKFALTLISVISIGLIFQAYDVIDLWFQAKIKSKFSVYVKNGSFLIVSLLKILLIKTNGTLIEFAFINLSEVILGSIGLLIVNRKSGNKSPSLNINFLLAKKLIHESWPLLISSLFVLLTMQLDKIILGQMQNSTQLGYYSVAINISSLWYVIPVLIGASIAPDLSRNFKDNLSNYHSKLQHVYNVMSLVSILALALTIAISNKLISFLYGDSYIDASEILIIHIWGAIFVFHVSIRTRAWIVENKQKYIMYIAGLTFSANLILNIFLIDKYGAVGAAYASSFSWVLCAIFFPLFWSKTRANVSMLFKSFLPYIIKK